MNFNKSACATAMALILAGCGSGSDNGNSGGGDTDGGETGRAITVIDGYLERAEVCVDRNNNGICDVDEFLGITKANGKFTIPKEDIDYPVLVRAIGGFSIDQDRIGYVTETYEMVAQADSAVVTPFTTVAAASDMSVEELANYMGLDNEIISGDYISSKEDDNTHQDAVAAHALARSLVGELPSSATELDGDALKQAADDILDAINSYAGEESLDNIDFVRSEDGEFEAEEVINDLQAYLVGSNTDVAAPETVWNTAPFSMYYAATEDPFSVWLTQDEMCVDEDEASFSPECMTYSVDGSTLVIGAADKSERDEFIYTSANIALTVPEQGDLGLWTTDDIANTSIDFTAADFEEKTWFMVVDDSNSNTPEPIPVYAEFQFGNYDAESNEGVVTLVEDGENYKTTWSIDSGNLTVVFDEQPGDHDWVVSYSVTNGSLMIVKNHNRSEEVYSLMTQDIELATNIIEKWSEVAGIK
jgi:hypothetical protein